MAVAAGVVVAVVVVAGAVVAAAVAVVVACDRRGTSCVRLAGDGVDAEDGTMTVVGWAVWA